MDAQFFRKYDDVVALPKSIDRHLAECPRILSHSSFSHLQLLSILSVNHLSQKWGQVQVPDATLAHQSRSSA